jgi:predicted Zn-dependent protease
MGQGSWLKVVAAKPIAAIVGVATRSCLLNEAVRLKLGQRAISPADPWIQALAGRIAYEKQDYDGAVQHLREAIRLRPNNLQARYTLAQAYRALGQQDDAAREAEQVQHLRQENPKADEDSFDLELLFPVHQR